MLVDLQFDAVTEIGSKRNGEVIWQDSKAGWLYETSWGLQRSSRNISMSSVTTLLGNFSFQIDLLEGSL